MNHKKELLRSLWVECTAPMIQSARIWFGGCGLRPDPDKSLKHLPLNPKLLNTKMP